MLYDVRTYRCQPGTIAAQLKLYEEHEIADPQWQAFPRLKARTSR